ncbi:MAG TPA: ATP-binding cassette domain-containing protein [Arachidicoccus soli]|nr:ATP-binding cassette domain-containing protein [Arachidicoccus soli]
MNILSLNNISKRYGAIIALNRVSFDVPDGSIFGILGPNGSGKTTLLSIITDVLRADEGGFTLFEKAATPELRKHTGTLLETPNFYHYLSAKKNLEITANIKGKGLQQIDEVLKRVELYERRNSKFSTFSLGMKQRLAIAAALLGNPKLLILDEPTNGLDPNGIADIRNLIKSLAEEGQTIVMASHLLDEVEKVCTHVAIIKRGNLLAAGHVNDVLKNDDSIEVAAESMEQLKDVLEKMNGFTSMESKENMILIHAEPGKISPMYVNKFCFENGITLTHLSIHKKTLEAKFLEITN